MSTIAYAHASELSRTSARPHRDVSHKYATLLGGKGRAAFYRLERTPITNTAESALQAVDASRYTYMLLIRKP